MKRFKKELLAVGFGFLFAYAWQLFALLMCSLLGQGIFITWKSFIPSLAIQIAALPIVAWIAMGVLRVRWHKTWLRITKIGIAFMIPFLLISFGVIFWKPSLWGKGTFWAINVIISIILTFKPLLKEAHKDS